MGSFIICTACQTLLALSNKGESDGQGTQHAQKGREMLTEFWKKIRMVPLGIARRRWVKGKDIPVPDYGGL
jgi:hypothetical protein